jgi:hypothetical protein
MLYLMMQYFLRDPEPQDQIPLTNIAAHFLKIPYLFAHSGEYNGAFGEKQGKKTGIKKQI